MPRGGTGILSREGHKNQRSTRKRKVEDALSWTLALTTM